MCQYQYSQSVVWDSPNASHTRCWRVIETWLVVFITIRTKPIKRKTFLTTFLTVASKLAPIQTHTSVKMSETKSKTNVAEGVFLELVRKSVSFYFFVMFWLSYDLFRQHKQADQANEKAVHLFIFVPVFDKKLFFILQQEKSLSSLSSLVVLSLPLSGCKDKPSCSSCQLLLQCWQKTCVPLGLVSARAPRHLLKIKSSGAWWDSVSFEFWTFCPLSLLLTHTGWTNWYTSLWDTSGLRMMPFL